MAWAKNGNAVGASATSVDMTLTNDLKFNFIMSHSVESTQNQEFQINSDTGNNYARRFSSNGGSDNTQTEINGMPMASTAPSFSINYICDIDGEEKLHITSDCSAQTAGSGTAPGRTEQTNKYAVTTNRLTTITWKNESTSVNFTSASDISALGTD